MKLAYDGKPLRERFSPTAGRGEENQSGTGLRLMRGWGSGETPSGGVFSVLSVPRRPMSSD